MTKKLTAGVLQGTSYTEPLEVDWQGEKFEVEIRPLSNKQSAEIDAYSQEGLQVKGRPGAKGNLERTIDFDTRKSALGRSAGNIKAAAWGTTDESLTEKVIEAEWPPSVVKKVANGIRRITGMKIEDGDDEEETSGADELAKFPGDET